MNKQIMNEIGKNKIKIRFLFKRLAKKNMEL